MISIQSREAVTKGWSEDKKYRILDENGTTYLLRVTDKSQYDHKRREFQVMQELDRMGIPICRPIEFGENEDGVYCIHSWIEGTDLEEKLSFLSDTEQYVYGLQAGNILQTIHSLPAPKDAPDWEIRFNAKINRKIQRYLECPLKHEKGELLIEYLNHNRHLLRNRPQSFQHGDYHSGNMMIDEKGQLVIIDFNRSDYGDPWEEFNRIVWSAQASPMFATGMVNGYFHNQVPMEFWQLLALYIASNSLSSLSWAVAFGEDEIQTMFKQTDDIMAWYQDMTTVIPSWYQGNVYLQEMDRISFRLKEAFDFSFLKEYGQVFCVFDDQDSGNICFGTQKGDQKYFIKFAGAPAVRSLLSTEQAIKQLQSTLCLYQDLSHPNLIHLIDSKEVNNGFLLIFEWFDGICPGRMYPEEHKKFMQLPIEKRVQVLDAVMEFFSTLPEKGYTRDRFLRWKPSVQRRIRSNPYLRYRSFQKKSLHQ